MDVGLGAPEKRRREGHLARTNIDRGTIFMNGEAANGEAALTDLEEVER
jgi:hypothetical protein